MSKVWCLTVEPVPTASDLQTILEIIEDGYIEGEIESSQGERMFWKINQHLSDE